MSELSLQVPPRFQATIPWEPGSREHPTILHDSLTLTSFCTGISVSYRNRYVVVASFSDMLPWHHFCFAAVAPFSFRHGDKCLVSCSCQHFHKNCIKLVYIIRIMITTFKMFKIVVCIKLLDACGDFPELLFVCFLNQFKLLR